MPNRYDMIFSTAAHKDIGLAYKAVKRIGPLVFHMDTTNSRTREILMWEGMSKPGARLPGMPHTNVSFGTSFKHKATVARYGLKTGVPEEDIAEDPWRVLNQVIAEKSGAAARTFASYQEYLLANWLATQFSNTSGLETVDGTGTLSTSHPQSERVSGSDYYWSNRAENDEDISIEAVDAAITAITDQLTAGGWERMLGTPKQFITNTVNRRRAIQVLNSPMEFNTAAHAQNTLADFNISVVLWPYFRTIGSVVDLAGWVLQADEHGLYCATLTEPKFKSETDMDTGMFMLYGDHAYMIYCEDPHGLYGSLGG